MADLNDRPKRTPTFKTMSEFEKLIETFRSFPGVGRRQAERFAHFLARQDKTFIGDFSSSLLSVKETARFCARCHRLFFEPGTSALCRICSSLDRDRSLLMILEKDADLNHVERLGVYNGLYFVLGGVLPMRDENPGVIRMSELEATLKDAAKEGLVEIVLALGLTPEGDYTTHFLTKRIREIMRGAAPKVTVLGRGLSVGSELEYSDKETLRHALGSRKEDV